MKITKDIIGDLFPLYAVGECSPDTRALVEEYLRSNPSEAAELRRALNTPVSPNRPPSRGLDEVRSLREARRRLRLRSWVLGLAIFFSLAPFSFYTHDGKNWWLFMEAPKSAMAYGLIGVGCWIAYGVARSRSRSL